MKQRATHNICPEWDPIRQVCAPLNYDRLQSPAGYIESELTVGEPEFVVVCDDERSREDCLCHVQKKLTPNHRETTSSEQT